jgi:hypothetical protein
VRFGLEKEGRHGRVERSDRKLGPEGREERGLDRVGVILSQLLAMGSPLASGLVVVVFIGVAMAIGGVARTIGAFSAGSFGQGTLAFIGGMLTVGAGLVLTARPGIGLTTLTLWSLGQAVFRDPGGSCLSRSLDERDSRSFPGSGASDGVPDRLAAEIC